jgi:hypothetical protein
MKKFIKKMLGLDVVESNIALATQKLEELEKAKKEAEEALTQAQQQEELAKMTPKERANKRKEPWVSVLETHVNKDNPANGFFELDWNEYFVVQLREAGFGFEGDPDELVVDMWFKTLARNMLSEEGLDMNRSQGFINVQKLDGNRSEIG